MRTCLIALACVAGGCSGQPGGNATTVMSNFAGSVPGLFGVAIDARNPAASPSADEIVALGATRVRVELAVVDGDLAGAFAIYDDLLARYGARGLEILFVLDAATADGFVGAAQPDWSDGYVTSFSSRAGAIAAHYAASPWRGQIAGFEIWSEEDLACDPAAASCALIPAARYAELFGAAADAIHLAMPGAIAVVGGLASGQSAYLADFKQALGGHWDAVGAIGLHLYGSWPSSAAENGEPPMAPILDALDRAAGGARPLFITGWGTANAALQPDLLGAFYDYFAAPSSRVAQAYLSCWSDTQQPGFGLYNPAGAPKPARQTFHDAAARPTAIAATTRLHGTVRDGSGLPLQGVQVTALGRAARDFHATTTGPLGTYAFDALDAASQYDVEVNATLAQGQLVAADVRYGLAERYGVTLAAGPDGWHGEEFVLVSPQSPPPGTHNTPRLRGVLASNDVAQAGLQVMAFGQDLGDFHQTTTDALGVYQFTDLDPLSEYEVVVNATLSNGRPVAVDDRFRGEVRQHIALVAGPDGWHGEDFDISPIHPPSPPPPTPH